MARLDERLTEARRALKTLRDVADRSRPEILVRDAAIKRFEYTFEATWKAAQSFLRDVEGLDCASPKACIRLSRETGLIDDDVVGKALEMADDRNRTSHIYKEALAAAIYGRLAGHAETLDAWIAAMESGAAGNHVLKPDPNNDSDQET